MTTPPTGTPSTPIYGLYYLAEGQPARDTRRVLQANAETVEEALAAGGVAAPGAADLLAVAARVGVLESPPRALLRQSTAQTGLAAGFHDIVFGADDIDSHNGWASGAATRWTCPAGAGGTYAVEGSVPFGPLATGTHINARLVKSGVALPTGTGAGGQYGGAAGNSATTGSKLVTLVPGDYLILQGFAAVTWSTAVFSDAAASLTLWRVAS